MTTRARGRPDRSHHSPASGWWPRASSGELPRVLDAVLGAGRLAGPKTHGGQVAVTLPRTARPWTLPTRVWHTDAPYTEPLEPVCGALVFEFLERVDAGSGGTLVLAGSHRVAARFAGVASERRGREDGDDPQGVPPQPSLARRPHDRRLGTRRRAWSASRPRPSSTAYPVRVVELTGERGRHRRRPSAHGSLRRAELRRPPARDAHRAPARGGASRGAGTLSASFSIAAMRRSVCSRSS